MLRLGPAAVFFAHGAQRLFGAFGGDGLAAEAGRFAALGLEPALPLALGAGLLELGCALLLWLGLWTRAAALLLVGELLYGFAASGLPRSFLPAAGQPGLELGFLLASSLLALLLLGPGRLSIDASRARGRTPPARATARP